MDILKEKINIGINDVTKELLSGMGDFDGIFNGAYNIRQNSQCSGRMSTENISIENHPTEPGLVIRVKPGTKGERAYVPACVTEAGISDIVTNEFYIGEDADVVIIAGCGVHSEGGEALHSGLHKFVLEKGAKVEYIEKHIGTGGSDHKKINTTTEFFIGEGAVMKVVSEQIGGVDNAHRETTAILEDKAVMIVNERLLTDNEDFVSTGFTVTLKGDDSKADVISRSVARGNSKQSYVSRIEGLAKCTGHTECDAILTENGSVDAAPCLTASCPDASLIHEAAIGKIAGEQLIKLCSLGLTREEAEKKIIEGFLK